MNDYIVAVTTGAWGTLAEECHITWLEGDYGIGSGR